MKLDETKQAELDHLKLGYIPLLDSAALVVAKEKGFFADNGLDVALQAEPSWANIRDKVAFGLLDGAQMLGAMPIAMTLGVSPVHMPMVTAFSMGFNGNAITLSSGLYHELAGMAMDLHADPLASARALSKLVQLRATQGKPQLVFGHVYNFSSHNYLLRLWLASAGIDPDRDVRLVVAPPQKMADKLALGEIDGFCVGEPWNTYAVQQGLGKVIISGRGIWSRAPEKVLGVTKDWANKHPHTHRLLIRALSTASQWLEDAENREETAELLTKFNYIPLPNKLISSALHGSVLGRELPGEVVDEIYIFHRDQANFPFSSHALWYILQMYRWGHLKESLDMKATVRSIYRSDIYLQALEGERDTENKVIESVPSVLLGQSFHNPTVESLIAELASNDISHCRVDIQELLATNSDTSE